MSKEQRISDERLTEMLASARYDAENQESRRYKAEAEEQVFILTELQSLRSKPVAGVEVKPLEWDGNIGRAGTAFRYVIAEPDRTIGWRVWISIEDQLPSFFLTAKPENREAAVSFAEADYRQRILSALSLPAQEPVAYEVTDRLTIFDHNRVRFVGADDNWLTSARLDTQGFSLRPLYASPQPEAVITDTMAERAYEAFVAICEWSDWDGPEIRANMRIALTAALKEA